MNEVWTPTSKTEEEPEEEEGDLGGIWEICRSGMRRGRKECNCRDQRCSGRYRALEEDEEESEGSLDQLGGEEWEGMEEIEITVDSGAVDTVGPPGTAQAFPLHTTQASREGRYYRAANNSKIAIHGMKELKGLTESGDPIGMGVQIADVKKVLGSVRRMCEAGNKVVFDEDGSYVMNKTTGRKTPIAKETRGYKVRIWVPRSEGQGFQRQEPGRPGIRKAEQEGK